jgi:hypothetical protein
VHDADGLAQIAIANSAQANADQLPWVESLVRDLRSPIEVVAFIAG